MWIKKKIITPEIIAVIFVMLIGSYILFIKPIIGVADNGEFYKVINPNNLYSLYQNEEEIMFGYFNREYGIYKYENETSTTLFSTQTIFIRLAIYISKIFNNDNIFDIRFLSIILLTLHTVATYLFIKVFTKDIKLEKTKYIIVSIYILIFCDIGYISYFNSFYGEAIIISCFLLSVAILLYIIRFNKINLSNLILFSLVSLLFLGVNQKIAPLGILVAILIIRIGIVNRNRIVKITSILIGILFVGFSIILYKSTNSELEYVNRFHAMTKGTLIQGENPEKVLKDFGIDESYSLLKDSNFYENVPSINPNDERLIEEFYNKYSTPEILLYYLKNPKQFISILKVGIENAYSIRSKSMGNFEKSEGREYGAKSYFFSAWSSVKNISLFKRAEVTILFLLGFSVCSFQSYRKYYSNKEINSCIFEEVFLYIFLAGFSQIIISIVGAGTANITKNEFLYNLSFDLMVIMLVVKYLKRREEKEFDKR